MVERIFREPQFDALRCMTYHTDRHAFLDRCDRLLKFLIVTLGASVVAKYTSSVPIMTEYLDVAIVILGLLHIIYDFGARARTHEMLKKAYSALLSEIQSSSRD